MLDMTNALIMEIYREYDLKFDVAATELKQVLAGPDSPERKQDKLPTERQEAANMAALQAMMKGSDFGGPKG